MKHYIWISIIFIIIGSCFSLTATAESHYQSGKNQISGGFFNQGVVNFKIPTPPSPLFWRAGTEAARGIMLRYNRLLYVGWHFTLGSGLSVSNWSGSGQGFVAISAYLQVRFWVFINQNLGVYLLYSIAGPTYLTRRRFSGAYFSENIVFQDFLGLGMQLGKKRAINIELYILHYSNGDIFTHNSGIQVPVVISLGYTF